MNPTNNDPSAPGGPLNKHRMSINLNFRWLTLLLLVVIAAMLVAWKPWDGTAGDRTVKVSGQATVKAEPDEYVFYPSYEFNDVDKLTAKSEELVKELKKLGVTDAQIKTNAANYGRDIYLKGSKSHTLQLTITLNDEKLAQKVQDYLVGTKPKGEITPQYGFSDAKQKELEAQAKSLAETEARAKAEESAKNLGFKLGKLKSLETSSGFGLFDGCGPGGLCSGAAGDISAAREQSLSLQPGENELDYTVSVTYFIR